MENLEKNRHDIIETLEELKIKLTINQFLEISNKLVPRYFTISSSNLDSPNIVSVFLRHETLLTAKNNVWVGCFSANILEIKNEQSNNKNQKVNFLFQNSSFILPEEKKSVS